VSAARQRRSNSAQGSSYATFARKVKFDSALVQLVQDFVLSIFSLGEGLIEGIDKGEGEHYPPGAAVT
jgi:hypothetical protein